jgi:hypothetical protein
MLRRQQGPARSQELIFLDSDDDLGTVRAKLESSPADEIFLVVPRQAGTLRTPLEFRILARMAHELSTDVTVISTDGGRRQMARQEGLRSRRSYSGVRHLAEAAGAPKPGPLALLDGLPLPSLSAFFVLLILLALAFIALFVATPIMRVTLTPASENIQRDIQIVVDPDQRTDNVARAVLPGELLQSRFEVTGSVPTSGEKTVGREPARGEVVFSNGTANPVVLPARGVVVARNGVRFLLDNEVRIGAFTFSQARGAVTADQRGSIGNLEANQLASLDPPIDRVTVSNPRPMVGGSDQPAKAVTAADQTRLREQLVQRAREQAQAEFGARGGEAKSVPGVSVQVKIDSENYQPGIEAEGEQLTGTMTANASAVAWENQALNALVQKMLLSSYGPDYVLPLNQLRLTPPEVLEYQEGKVRLRIRADAVVVRTVDPAPIAEALRWKSDSEARTVLGESPGLADASIELSPPWAPRALRVEVDVATPK